MRQKQYDKVVKKMQEHLEPGEKVVGAFQARESDPYTLFLVGLAGVIPALIYKQRIVVVGDKNIYFTPSWSQKKVLKTFPRASTELTITGEKKVMMTEVKVGPTAVWAPKIEHKNVEELVGKLGPESAPAAQPA